MNKKKILFLMNNVKYGGGETVASNIIRNLSNKYDFIYACPQGIESKMIALFDRYEIPYYEFKNCTPITVRKLVNDFKPDIIHAHGFRASMCASFSMLKTPIIAHLHNYYDYLANINAKSLIFKLSCSKYKAVISCERKIAENSIFKQVIKNKSYVLENTIDYQNIIEQSNEYVTEKSYDLIYIANLVERKDPLRFIEIVNKVKKDIPNLSVALVGSGYLLEQCQEKISEYNLNENIDVRGFVKNPLPLLKTSKLLVMTSKNEGLPMVALEALALNKKLVVNENCGLNSVINLNNGVICESDREYKEHIVKLLFDNANCPNDESVNINKKFQSYISNVDDIYNGILI